MSYIKKIDKPAVAPLTGVSGNALLRTPCGPRRADCIRPGDLVVTRDNGLRPVQLIWRRSISLEEIVEKSANAPVTLNARAVGPMMPQRPLTLAPGHHVLIPGYQLATEMDQAAGLVEARALAGTTDAAFHNRDAERETFFNFVFDQHEIIVASGLPVASFLPSGSAVARVDEDTRIELVRRFPELRKKSATAFPAVRYPKVPCRDYLPSLA
ncbi:MAG: Hint domain-containing protein [Pseudomonadota bacterium]